MLAWPYDKQTDIEQTTLHACTCMTLIGSDLASMATAMHEDDYLNSLVPQAFRGRGRGKAWGILRSHAQNIPTVVVGYIGEDMITIIYSNTSQKNSARRFNHCAVSRKIKTEYMYLCNHACRR